MRCFGLPGGGGVGEGDQSRQTVAPQGRGARAPKDGFTARLPGLVPFDGATSLRRDGLPNPLPHSTAPLPDNNGPRTYRVPARAPC